MTVALLSSACGSLVSKTEGNEHGGDARRWAIHRKRARPCDPVSFESLALEAVVLRTVGLPEGPLSRQSVVGVVRLHTLAANDPVSTPRGV